MSGDGVSGAHLCSEMYASHPGQVREKERTCVEVQQSATHQGKSESSPEEPTAFPLGD